MSVLEAIQKGTDFLGKKNVESPRLQAELLLAHLLKIPRMNLYLNFAQALTPMETDALRGLIQRRGRREPLQHLVGSTSFCGYEIAVSRDALVPRPETELLAEEGWQWLATLDSPPAVLDFGTGTGCLAIALAVKCSTARIIALDLSTEALALAKSNAEKNNVAEHIEFLQGDGFDALNNFGLRRHVGALRSGDMSPHSKFDLILSNPPYIPTAEIETLPPEVRDFDPRLALDGGADGLDFYRRLATQAKAFLKPAGKIMLEFGDGQAAAIQQIFENEKWIVEPIKSDYSSRARILIARP